jgi:hypothetical protein
VGTEATYTVREAREFLANEDFPEDATVSGFHAIKIVPKVVKVSAAKPAKAQTA